MASRSLGEAILRALAGAGQELGGQMQENQKFNLQRGDMFERLKTDREERRRGAERDQFESDRAYDFNVKKTEDQASASHRGEVNQNIADFLKGIEEKNRYATQQGWLEKQFGLQERQEARLSREKTGTVPFAQSGPALGLSAIEDVAGATKDYRKDASEWRKSSTVKNAPYPGPPVDTSAILGNKYNLAQLLGQREGYEAMVGGDPHLKYFMDQLMRRGGEATWNPMAGGDLLAKFANPGMSAVGELNQPGPQGFNNTKMSQASFRDLNQPDQNGLQQAFQQQLPPDFNSWPPDKQQAAWEMFLEMQGQ